MARQLAPVRDQRMRRSLAAAALAFAVFALGASQGATSHGARADDESFILGVIPQQDPLGADFRAMVNGGVRSLRLAVFWPRVEPEFGAMDWSSYDTLVGRAARHGVTVFPYLYGTPSWAAHYDGIDCSNDCSIYAPQTSATRGGFAFFASEAVRQYGPGGQYWAAHPDLPYRPIRTWQVWNEQNSSKYFAPEPDVGSYAALLGRTAEAIRSVDPRAEIVLGGMWGPDGSSEVIPTSTYLSRLYRQPGGRESFDSIALHPYSSNPPGMLEQIRSARRAARRAGDGKAALWITELGWASKGPSDHYLVKGRRGQADRLDEAFSALLQRRERWRLRGAYWYAWRDTEPTADYICAWCPGAGLRTVSGDAKPAWRKLKRLARGS